MGDQADVVFTRGAVYTADAAGRELVRASTRTAGGTGSGAPATAVAVRGDRIIAVAEAAGDRISDLTGATTEVVDLRGRALLPGFQDAHVHPAFAGVTLIGCNLIGTGKLDEALARISAYAAAHPDKEWIAGSGWRMDWFEHG
ncbi:MAG TPA: amidohydrolase family protein, partial [Streptosporangiaceae bacterium]|nr:amidohydrolase family protein [Streptosporangiaceae bacterium]